MAKSKNRKWIDRHVSDVYVRKSKSDGFRSRASYKLLEILESKPLIRRGDTVVDLGCAPGGWSQVAKAAVGNEGSVIGVDILEMSPIPQTEFIQGDFSEKQVLDLLCSKLQNKSVKLVISDMAPNITGVSSIDLPAHYELVDLALEFCLVQLSEGGHFIIKLFQGSGFDSAVNDIRKFFKKIKLIKPEASRKKSREVYLLGEYFRQQEIKSEGVLK
tara:strand:- start:353 stop:1000 length:648 start_codon:yes stop_codon:yes gene_type:complete